jgi:hypothetical protein
VYSTKPHEYNPKDFKEILDSFTPALVKHLNDEIPTLLALEKYGGDKLLNLWQELEKRILAGAIDPVFSSFITCNGIVLMQIVSCDASRARKLRQNV